MQNPYWGERVTTPRKWFWLPPHTPWFTIEGDNMGPTDRLSIELPSTYGIICDAISIERPFSMACKEDRRTAMKLARFLGNTVDPHIYNFVHEKDTGRIAIIDTEHFASLVGLREPLYFNHYTSWYCRLTDKCITDALFRTKKDRRARQQEPTPALLNLYPKKAAQYLEAPAQKEYHAVHAV